MTNWLYIADRCGLAGLRLRRAARMRSELRHEPWLSYPWNATTDSAMRRDLRQTTRAALISIAMAAAIVRGCAGKEVSCAR